MDKPHGNSLDDVVNSYVSKVLGKVNVENLDPIQLLLMVTSINTMMSEIIQIIVEEISSKGSPQLYKVYQRTIEASRNIINSKIGNRKFTLDVMLMLLMELSKVQYVLEQRLFEKMVKIAGEKKLP